MSTPGSPLLLSGRAKEGADQSSQTREFDRFFRAASLRALAMKRRTAVQGDTNALLRSIKAITVLGTRKAPCTAARSW